jgi:hypothetical protein
VEMQIGLIDVDSHNFPNLALMKISTFHKSKGDHVEMWNGLKHYDKVYMAKVFTEEYSKDMNYCINADEIIKGGTGYDLENRLPYEIEHLMPDYSLYGIQHQSIGFLTRGCPRGCKFCIVGEKEGLKSVNVAELSEFWTGQKQITLLDPNITACADCEDLFKDLIKSKAWIDFTQGIDIRCMNDKKAELINQMKLKILHFAWDNYEFGTYEKLKYFRPMLKFDGRKLRVYVLTNFDTTHEQDLERIYKLRELDYDPYLMIFNRSLAPKKTRRMARWVNNKFIWRTCERFENYEH